MIVGDRDVQQRLDLAHGTRSQDVLAHAGDGLNRQTTALQPGHRGVETRLRHAELLLVLIRIEELPVQRARRVVLTSNVRQLARRIAALQPNA